MESIQGNIILASINFPNNAYNFTLGLSRSQPEEFQRRIRHPREDSEREVILTISLPSESLITHTSIYCKQISFIQFIRVEAGDLNDCSLFNTMFNIHPIKQVKTGIGIITSNIGYTKTIRLTFLLKQHSETELLSKYSIKMDKKGLQAALNTLFQQLISKIQFWGYQTNCSPPASMLPQLLNISTLFKKYSRDDQGRQVDILLGLCLINSRRFTQATQHLKKVSESFVKKYHSVKNSQITPSLSLKGDNSKLIKVNESDIFFFNSINCPNLINSSSKKSLLRAAKVQLLIAEAVNQPTMINEKIKAYYRAAMYFSGTFTKNCSQQNKQLDIYTGLLEIGPLLVRFLLKMLQDRFEPLRLAAIKSLQYVLQTIGCSVGNYLPQILKSIILTYPNEDANHNKQLVDHYHHLIQTFINLLSMLSKSLCRIIFQEIIMNTLFLSELQLQIRLYLIRLTDKIIVLCSADLQIPIFFIQGVLKIIEGKALCSPSVSKDRQSLLVYHCQKLFEIIKSKYLSQNTVVRLQKYGEWINQQILSLCQYQINQINLNSLDNMLDLINVIYSQQSNSIYPIPPLLYFLDLSLNQPSLPFDKILQTLGGLLRYTNTHDTVVDIIQKIISRSKVSNLSLKEIKVFIEMVSIHGQAEIMWLEQFLKCIPHSTFDQVFTLLDLLLMKCKKLLQTKLILSVVVTLLDQYTVKGKAYKKTKELFLSLVLKQNPETTDHFINFIYVCLLNNHYPSAQNLQTNKLKMRKFDSKLYSQEVELFSEKLSFACELIQLIDKNHLKRLFQVQIMQKLKVSLTELLTSNNSKTRIKGIGIIKSLIDCYVPLGYEINEKTLLFSKTLLNSIHSGLQTFRESRLQFNLLYFLLRIFDDILKAKNSTIKLQSTNDCDVQLLDLSKPLRYQINDPFYLTLRIREVIKLWSSLIPYVGSTWAFNKEICCLLLSRLFLINVDCYRNPYSMKLCELSQPIVTNLLQSVQFQDRYYGLKIFAFINQINNIGKQNIQKGCNKLRECFSKVLSLCGDWNQKVSQAANAIVLIGFDRNTRSELDKNKYQALQNNNINNMIANSFFSQDFQFQQQQARSYSQTLVNLSQNIEIFLRQTQNIQYEEDSIWSEERKEESKLEIQRNAFQSSIGSALKTLQTLEKDDRELLQQWNQKNLSNELVQVIEQQHFFPIVDEGTPLSNLLRKKADEDQQHLDFQDLGIIEVDDEQWNDYESEMAMITSNLPVKRKFKLSPNIGNPNRIDLPFQPISIIQTEKLPVSPSKFQSLELQKQEQKQAHFQQRLLKKDSQQDMIKDQKSDDLIKSDDDIQDDKQQSSQLRVSRQYKQLKKSEKKKQAPKSSDLRKSDSPMPGKNNRKGSARKKSSKLKPNK